MTFNLVDEQWIPVLFVSGATGELSLRDIFLRAHEVRRIDTPLPTQAFALLRMLEAVSHDAVGYHSRDDISRVLREGLDLAKIDAYLTRYRERFDLFHAERPFMQVATLRTAKNEVAGLEKLISDVPNNDPFLTTRGGESLRRISAAEAALWLIHCHSFDPSGIRSAAVGDPETSGGKGYPIGPSWAGQLGGVALHGESLARTLVYNLVPTPRNPIDRPVWALDLPQSEQREMEPDPAGPISLLVWQSRRIRLVGDRAGVTGVVLSQGDKMTPQNRHEVEHMSAWRFSAPQTKKHGIPVYMPQKHDPSRSGWRGMPGLVSEAPSSEGGHIASLRPATVRNLAEHSGEFAELDTQVLIELVGMQYGPQEATVEDVAHDMLDLRVSLLGEDGVEVREMLFGLVETAEKSTWHLARMAGNIARAAGDFDGVEGAQNRARELGWAAIDGPARRWLSKLSADTDVIEARRAWHVMIRDVLVPLADALAESCGPAAIAGRNTKYGFLTSAKAENFFHKDLRKEIPLAYPKPIEKESNHE